MKTLEEIKKENLDEEIRQRNKNIAFKVKKKYGTSGMFFLRDDGFLDDRKQYRFTIKKEDSEDIVDFKASIMKMGKQFQIRIPKFEFKFLGLNHNDTVIVLEYTEFKKCGRK